MNDRLRKEVKILKATKGISYKAIAERLGMATNSLYNWLRGQYDLSEERQIKLQGILSSIES